MNTDTLAFENEEQRRRAVAWVVALASTFPVGPRHAHPSGNEQQAVLKTGVYQVLYRSTATRRFTNDELLKLLEHARSFNLEHQVTGMLLYSEGHFVQVIEGAEEVVSALYERIRQDPWHHEIETVNEGPLPARRFAEWSMDFGFEAQPDTGPASGTSPPQYVLPGLSTTSAHLKLLLEAFIG